MSERALRNVVEQAFSLAAWINLLKLYTQIQNTKSILISLDEAMQQLEDRGIVEMLSTPSWIERSLSSAVQARGLKFVVRLVKEN